MPIPAQCAAIDPSAAGWSSWKPPSKPCEIREELDTECELGKFHGYVENLYKFHGHNGHEIMALWDVNLANKNLYELEQVPYAEECLAHDFVVWRNPFKAELPVWPSTMLKILEVEAPLD